MRFLVWFLGLMQLLFALEASGRLAVSWWWVWAVALVFWCVAAVALVISGVVRVYRRGREVVNEARPVAIRTPGRAPHAAKEGGE